ncbi:hypothetical protein [Hyalangium gracile]|uniref:hypothetical protein n=1 Tax=Hyalangium gracile TaxID=394092 RepID=UPI001CCEE24D|nr:hypothetical protein [Hyalangium gracile]
MTRSSTKPSSLLPAPLEQLLACASLREELGSLILYDASTELLEQVARRWLGNLAVLGVQARRVQLGPWTTEEDLWGYGDSLPVELRRSGLLDSDEPRLVVIPDLSRLSLAALRACASWMGSEHVSIERVGQVRRFRPHCYWLAGCAMAEVGQVSLHLLDRFALRVRAPSVRGDATAELLRALQPEPPSSSEAPRAGPEAGRLLSAAQVRVRLSKPAREALLERFPASPGTGHRGLITLARTACAVAQLAEATVDTPRPRTVELQASHVHQAARWLQLPSPAQRESPESKSPEPAASPAGPQEAPPQAPPPAGPAAPSPEKPPVMRFEEAPSPPVSVVPVHVSEVEVQPAAALPPLEVERDPRKQREYAPLRLPTVQGGMSAKDRGAVIGVQPATDLQDLAIVSTVLAAAPYQNLRREQSDSEEPELLLTRSDLRTYRRAPAPQHLLALVLDFTSMRTDGWQQALAPYLSQAYVERAMVCVIQVGAREDDGAPAGSELRAREVMSRSLLVPAVGQALEAQPGRATPLADGLERALATLRRTLRVGRGAAHHAWLVVVTDGRGNVPLEASRTGILAPLVGRQGVEDALRIAAQLRGMRQVSSVVIKPPLAHLKSLPAQLAGALGAQLVDFGPPAHVAEDTAA